MVDKAKRIIKLPQLTLDFYKPHSPVYNVQYYLLTSDVKAENITLKMLDNIKHRLFTGVCFSALNSIGTTINKYNKILYKFRLGNDLSVSEAKKWILLAKKNKLIPKYTRVRYGKISDSSDKCECYVVFDFTNINKNTLYMFLSTVRYLDEYPNFVKAVMELVKFRVNFYAAFVIASYGCIDRDVHHIINCVRPFASTYHKSYANFYNNIDIDIKWILGLAKFANNYSEYDTLRLSERFRCSVCISALKDVDRLSTKINVKYFFIPKIVKYIVDNPMSQDLKTQLNNISKLYKFELPPVKTNKKAKTMEA